MSDVPDDILNISAATPLETLLEIDRVIKPTNVNMNSPEGIAAVNTYYDLIRHSYQQFDFDFGLNSPAATNPAEAVKLLFGIKTEIDKIKINTLRARKINEDNLALDESWKSKIHSYISTIREIVQKAEISVPLRERIIGKLHELDKEVDRERTPMRRFTDTLVELCRGVSEGAVELTPGIRVMERLIGALERLRSAIHPAPTLPTPETLGLPAPEAFEEPAPE